jgi:HSP20 family protein
MADKNVEGTQASKPQAGSIPQGQQQGGQQAGTAERGMQRRGQASLFGALPLTPFSLARHALEDMFRLMDDFGSIGGRDTLGGRDVGGGTARAERAVEWAPAIEVFERDGQFLVRADLPGLSPDDVRIEVSDDALTIEGERTSEVEAEDEGMYRREVVYGRFMRTIPLPDGVDPNAAKARFDNGVLEITFPMQQDRTQRRRVQIEGSTKGKDVH